MGKGGETAGSDTGFLDILRTVDDVGTVVALLEASSVDVVSPAIDSS